MKKLIIGLVLVMCLLVLSCTPTTSAPVLTNSESSSRIAELEAKIRQLEAENQHLMAESQQLEAENKRLLTENRELSSENQRLLTENEQLRTDNQQLNVALQRFKDLVTSSSYANARRQLYEIQHDTNEFAVFLEGLPDLPPPPPGLTIAQINNAIEKARDLRALLRDLPDLPPSGWPFFIPFPEELLALDEMRQTFITMTEWMEGLKELPEFLNIAGDLDDVRYQEIDHLHNINASTYDIIGILEQVRDAIQP